MLFKLICVYLPQIIKSMEYLVIIDMQNDFLNGSLANYDSERVINNVVGKINSFNGKRIFLTRDTHQENYLETNEGKKLPIRHCISGSNGWEIESKVDNAVREAQKRGVDIVWVDKPTFGSLALAKEISYCIQNDDNGNDNSITLVGVCTDICVVSNALLLKAFNTIRETSTIYVDEKCCSGLSKESHDAAIMTMRNCQIEII